MSLLVVFFPLEKLQDFTEYDLAAVQNANNLISRGSVGLNLE